MMNKQEAMKRIEQIEKEAKELRALIDAPEKKSNWFVPKSGERFLYIDSWGEVMESSCVDQNRHFFKINKFFRKSDSHLAERESKRRAAEIKYLKAIADGNKGEVFDWKDNKQEKWYAKYDHDIGNIVFTYSLTSQIKHSDFYSVSQKAAQAAVACLTDEEKDLVFKS